MKQEDLDLIDKYLLGHLAAAEKVAVEERLAEDQLFYDHFEAQKLIHEGTMFNALMTARQKIENIEASMESASSKSSNSIATSRIQIKRIFAVAACLGIIIFGILLYQKSLSSNQATFTAYFEPYKSVFTNERTEGVYDGELLIRQAFEMYENKSYAEAIKLLKAAIKNDNNPDLVFYLANAQLANGDATSAINTFNKYLLLSTEFKPQAIWYLALAHIKLDQIEKGCELLNKTEEFDTTYREMAASLSKKICK